MYTEIDNLDGNKVVRRPVDLAQALEFFNPFHAPSGGPTGGQFTSKSGGPAAGSTKPPAHGKQTTAQAKSYTRQKIALLTQARSDRQRAAGMKAEIGVLEGQLRSAMSKSTTTKAKKAGVKKRTSKVKKSPTKKATKTTGAKKVSAAGKTAANKAALVGSLTTKIIGLRSQMHSLLAHANKLTRQASML